MRRIYDEGIKQVNNLPLPIDCLIMRNEQPAETSALSGDYLWDELHYHQYIELLYAVEGDFEVYINGDVLFMPVGSMAIINAGELHATRRIGPRHTLLCIKFIPQILYSSEQTVTEMEYSIPYVFERFGFCRCFTQDVLEETFLPQAFARVKDEQIQKAFGYELAIRAEVMRIFAWIIRFWHTQADAQDLPAPGEAAVMRRAKEYVRAHYVDATLASAAEYCCLSYSYFSRLFNRCMKMPFSHYVNQERVNHSMKDLVLTDKSVTEIALSSGFSSTSYYIQIFRKLKNISPNQFRKTFNQGGNA